MVYVCLSSPLLRVALQPTAVTVRTSVWARALPNPPRPRAAAIWRQPSHPSAPAGRPPQATSTTSTPTRIIPTDAPSGASRCVSDTKCYRFSAVSLFNKIPLTLITLRSRPSSGPGEDEQSRADSLPSGKTAGHQESLPPAQIWGGLHRQETQTHEEEREREWVLPARSFIHHLCICVGLISSYFSVVYTLL